MTCDFEHRVERYAQRTGFPLAAALAKSNGAALRSYRDEEKVRHADYVIENSGSVEDTERQVEEIWNKLQTLAGG